ncbi:CHRD domain-containing protein [Chitinophaga sp. NPDC101104]|uniref:CHRD domain-containing protein n=1 Tax=Chitinophaga sp. NPDC101104 TaxID=3390561 RepID=UPI003CFD4BF7
MLRARFAGLILVASLLAFSCRKINDGDYYTRNRDMTGKQEVPRVWTSASGYFTFIYTPGSGKVRLDMHWEDLSSPITHAYIQGPAARGENAGMLVDFSRKIDRGEEGEFTTKFFLNGTNQLEGDLLAGRWYINIQTENYPKGEIRGQIELKLK